MPELKVDSISGLGLQYILAADSIWVYLFSNVCGKLNIKCAVVHSLAIKVIQGRYMLMTAIKSACAGQE